MVPADDRAVTMDIGGWLRSLDLERYEAAFRENEINEKVFPNLTAEDLKDLGVSIVGHRRTLLDAIAALRAAVDTKAPPAVGGRRVALESIFFFRGKHGNEDADDRPQRPFNPDAKNFKVKARPRHERNASAAEYDGNCADNR